MTHLECEATAHAGEKAVGMTSALCVVMAGFCQAWGALDIVVDMFEVLHHVAETVHGRVEKKRDVRGRGHTGRRELVGWRGRG